MSQAIESTRQARAAALADLPDTPAGRETMAAEYAVGVLDARTVQRVRAAMQIDPAWRESVAAWERRLAPLALLARPEPAPPNVWDRIEARISPAEAPRVRRQQRAFQIWRGVAVLGVLAVLGIGGYAYYARLPRPRLMTVLVNDRNLPGVLVERDSRGDLRLVNVPAATGRQLQAPAGKALQIWAVATGAQAPTNLGVLPYEPSRQIVIPAKLFRPVADMLIEITVEQEGGSTTGRPAGPVIFIGRLAEFTAGG